MTNTDYDSAWPPANFLGLPPEYAGRDTVRALVLPIPYEASTSYGGGTRNGPRAILEASAQVELYDRDLNCEPAVRWGIHTLPALATPSGDAAAAMNVIADTVATVAASGQLLAVLGGEHSLSAGVARGLARVVGPLTIVHLDAHADLRDTYDGSPYSHACAVRRMLEVGPVVQMGIRSWDIAEAEFITAHPADVLCVSADEMHAGNAYQDRVRERIAGRTVFLTLDIDALDPSLMPATGTPEPGGLSWQQMIAAVRLVAAHSHVAAFDCVELSPIPGLPAPTFVAAKLVYKTLGILLAARAASE